MSEQLLTLAAVAERLGCSERTLRRRIKHGLLPVFRDGGIVRVREHDLRAYIARRTNEPQPAQPRPQLRRRQLEQPRVRSLFELPDPLVDRPPEADLSSGSTHKCPGGADTPRGRHQGGTP